MKRQITQNKFLQILAKLSLKERKGFYHFLNGCYASQKVQLSLYNYLYQLAPDFDQTEHLEIHTIYKVIFQQEMQSSKDRKNLLNAFSDLTKWLEDYLIVKELQQQSFDRCLLYTSPSPRDLSTSRMPSSA